MTSNYNRKSCRTLVVSDYFNFIIFFLLFDWYGWHKVGISLVEIIQLEPKQRWHKHLRCLYNVFCSWFGSNLTTEAKDIPFSAKCEICPILTMMAYLWLETSDLNQTKGGTNIHGAYTMYYALGLVQIWRLKPNICHFRQNVKIVTFCRKWHIFGFKRQIWTKPKVLQPSIVGMRCHLRLVWIKLDDLSQRYTIIVKMG